MMNRMIQLSLRGDHEIDRHEPLVEAQEPADNVEAGMQRGPPQGAQARPEPAGGPASRDGTHVHAGVAAEHVVAVARGVDEITREMILRGRGAVGAPC